VPPTVRQTTAVACASLFALFLLPAVTWAQATAIAGTVRDTSGAVLPGVTVEASSPALIEKARSAVTDGQGIFRIIDLRPGVYAISFSLPGFATVRREGIELNANFTATINAEMQVGTIETAVTVTGASPVVDVVNVLKQEVVTKDVLETLPVSKSLASFTALVPGLAGARDIGGVTGDRPVGLTMHGSRGNDQHVYYNGMRTNNMNAGGSTGGGTSSSIYYNPAMIQEITMEVGAQSVTSETSGVSINVVPREGGNRFSATLLVNGTTESLQSNNLNDELIAQGITTPQKNKEIWDVNPGGGGPIKRDKLWFYTAYRNWGSSFYVPGAFFNSAPLEWQPAPDPSRPAYDENNATSGNLRFTWQVSQKNKLSFGYENQDRCICFSGVSGTTLPEASQRILDHSKYWQVKWTNPVTSRLLLQAGVQGNFMNWRGAPQPGVPEDLYSVVEQRTSVRFRNTTLYNSRIEGEGYNSETYNFNGQMDYVTGTHNISVGTNVMLAVPVTDFDIDGGLEYRTLDGKPSQVIQRTTPFKYSDRLEDVGIWVGDQWKRDRLTLSLGLRYLGLFGGTPEQHIRPGPFIPERVFPEVMGVVSLHEIVPRIGGAYDLFGNGKTALKVSMFKFVEGQGTNLTSAKNPQFTVVNSVTRQWIDADNDFVPDCDLLNMQLNGECGVGNALFGQTTTPTNVRDDATLHGWGNRSGVNWEFSTSVQHELLPNFSVNVGYFRRMWSRFLSTDNLLVTPSDYSPYCTTAPLDSRLPDGGGYEICGLYDISREKFNQVSSITTWGEKFGEEKELYQGVDFNVNARLRGTTVQGGVNLGRTETDDCNVIIDSPQKRFCNVAPPFMRPDVKLSATRALPWDMQVAGTFQSTAGPQITASYTIRSDQTVGLGRPLSAGQATVALIEPGTMYNDRYNQLDVRLTKTVRLPGRVRLRGMVDSYNLFNTATSLSHNNTFGGQWLRPQTLPPGRFVKFGMQLDY
jgi:hypothetical protein